jgi:hypothetical protein
MLATIVFVSQSCKKVDKEPIKSKSTTEKSFTEINYDLNYFPAENFDEILQEYFDNINEYYKDSTVIINDYNINDGIWCIESAVNYTKAKPFAQIENIVDVKFSINIKLTNNNSQISGKDLVKNYIKLYSYLSSLNKEENQIFQIQLDNVLTNGNVLTINFIAMIGEKTSFNAVNLASSPTGVPNNATLKMGYSYSAYQSAAKEIQKRYNRYLWTSIHQQFQNATTYYLVVPYNSYTIDGWYDYNNCHYQYPVGDFILYVGWSANDYMNALVSGSRFNTYLDRYFQKRITPYINDNLSTTQLKYMYTRVHNYGNTGCAICGYNFPYSHSSVGYRTFQSLVKELPNPLNTYIW